MEKISTIIEGLFFIQSVVFHDNRGEFIKIFNEDSFLQMNLSTDIKEFYYSISHKNVIRGLHFQVPPAHCNKLVYVSHGRILDVSVDLRKSTPSFGKIYSVELSRSNGGFLFIPKGVAHGFLSLENNTVVNYAQTSCYSKDCDKGILFNSIDFDWGIDNPIISKRDYDFPKYEEFLKENPFI